MVYQRTRVTDPKDPRKNKRLSTKIEKIAPHTIQMKIGSLLRQSGVSFESEAEENQAVTVAGQGPNSTSTPGPSTGIPEKSPNRR